MKNKIRINSEPCLFPKVNNILPWILKLLGKGKPSTSQNTHTFLIDNYKKLYFIF